MGYRCPVCDDPQPDGEHLANHVAFTGLLGDDDHEKWLDETVPSWSEMDPDSLSDVLIEEVPEVDLGDIETDAARPPGRPEIDSHARRTGDQEVDPETAAALEEARELTRQMEGTPEDSHEESENDGETNAPKGDGDSEGEDR
jgi:hypothetical protein